MKERYLVAQHRYYFDLERIRVKRRRRATQHVWGPSLGKLYWGRSTCSKTWGRTPNVSLLKFWPDSGLMKLGCGLTSVQLAPCEAAGPKDNVRSRQAGLNPANSGFKIRLRPAGCIDFRKCRGYATQCNRHGEGSLHDARCGPMGVSSNKSLASFAGPFVESSSSETWRAPRRPNARGTPRPHKTSQSGCAHESPSLAPARTTSLSPFPEAARGLYRSMQGAARRAPGTTRHDTAHDAPSPSTPSVAPGSPAPTVPSGT